ncbi:MAG: NAD(P)H-dependent oxidoreductase [Verrucomicrobiota bacterium]
MTDKRILWYLFHPKLNESRGNRALLDAVCDLPGLTLVDSYAECPEWKIDVQREQARLVEHDLIVFQHPFYWYSVPALFKEWMDLVLEYGFAYPPKEGRELHGKHWLSVVTTGGPHWSYQAGGYNNYTMHELLRPLQQTANLCGLRWHPPFLMHGVLPGDYEGIQASDDDTLRTEGARLRKMVEDLDLAKRHSLEAVLPSHFLATQK